jgi:hypothetical protein
LFTLGNMKIMRKVKDHKRFVISKAQEKVYLR